MKMKFTYKEFSLLLGIAVALIIILSLWLRPVQSPAGEVSRKILPEVPPVSPKVLVNKAVVLIQDSLR